MKIEIGIAIAVAGAIASGHLWDTDRRDTVNSDERARITADEGRRNTEGELQRTELEIKMLVEWSTRRQLTESEADRLEYLRQLRVLLKQQLGG